ncbi:DUF6701 domain-containing protein [Shewanella mangrovi]|uniref:DUF6701 domain-containing protein n=1 Tax=Shewanella mangrovi TaxID=1515746 RepID=UPI00068EB1AC|nr:DUF6701 domain-containing protein [Shewanella mangrovi]
MNKYWLLLWLCLSFSASAFEQISDAQLFPAVVQGHHGVGSVCSSNSALTIYTGQIIGTGGEALNFCSSNNQNSMESDTCDDGLGNTEKCSVSGSDVQGLDLNSVQNQFQATSGGASINWGECNADRVLGQHGETDFGSVVLDGDACHASFSTDNSTFHFASLLLNGRAEITFHSGDYWIDSLTLNDGTPVVHIDGNVRLFVNNFKVNDAAQLNPERSGKLTVIAYNTITVAGNNAELNGNFYAENSMTIHGFNIVNGHITARTLDISLNGIVNGAALPNCRDIFTYPPTDQHAPDRFVPPLNLEPSRGDLSCSNGSPCSFGPGDYNFTNGTITEHGQGANALTTSGKTTRLYFDSLTIDKAALNLQQGSNSGDAANLLIYVRNQLVLNGRVDMNGILYLAKDATITGSFKLYGAIAGGQILSFADAPREGDTNGGSIHIDLSVVDEADFGGMCSNTTVATDTIDHFQLDFSANPNVCAPASITVLACENSDCTSLYSGNISVTMSPATVSNGQWLGGNTLQFSQGTATIALQKNDALPITIGIEDSTPIATNGYVCNDANNSNCTLSFSEAGFIFDVPDKVAGRAAEVLIKAVKKDEQTQQCVSAFASVSKPIKLWSSVVSRPMIEGYVPPAVQVNALSISDDAAAPSLQTLSFDASGQASVQLDYHDAGKLTLNAQYTGSGDDAGLVVAGSDSFVSFPAGLCVAAVDSDAQCPSADASCSGYRAAGDVFAVNIRAKQWRDDGNICAAADTPSFAMADVAMSQQLIAPAAGQPGELASHDYDQLASVSGTTINQSISEVGVFALAASSQQAYLGSSAFTLAPFYSDPIGRFYPASFIADGISVPPSCDGFSYMTQPLSLSMTLKALNRAGQLTQNYTGTFANGSAQLLAENNNNGIDLSSRLSAVSGSWLNGQMQFTQVPFSFARAAAPLADGPFSALALGVEVTDPDSVPMSLANMLVTSANDCAADSNCSAQQLTTLDIRLGRALLANTYGPENHPVLMAGSAQYWNGSQWQSNPDDSCSVVSPAMLSQTTNATLGYLFEPALASGQAISRTGAPAALSNGDYSVRWLSSGTYRGKVTAPVGVPEWLQWYWGFDGAGNTVLLDPRASAYFGRYRGNDRVINWREQH